MIKVNTELLLVSWTLEFQLWRKHLPAECHMTNTLYQLLQNNHYTEMKTIWLSTIWNTHFCYYAGKNDGPVGSRPVKSHFDPTQAGLKIHYFSQSWMIIKFIIIIHIIMEYMNKWNYYNYGLYECKIMENNNYYYLLSS